MTHPYKAQPDTAFWARSVAQNWDARSLAVAGPLLRSDDRIASFGSCFAAHLVPYLRQCGFEYVQEETRHQVFADAPPERFSYDKFSAAYGNIYTARQFRQLLDRAFGSFRPREDRWEQENVIIDPFRPGLRYPARTHAVFDALTEKHLSCVRSVFQKATVMIVTLGLTEAWESRADGAVFPACPGTIAGTFDRATHRLRNFTVAEIISDLEHVLRVLGDIRPDVRLIVTVSPVPLVATATHDHVVIASTYSKSVLRAACGEVCERHSGVVYFPSYEIITGPQAPDDFFEADKRNVSANGIDEVMRAFLDRCAVESPANGPARHAARDDGSGAKNDTAAHLSKVLTQIECEEEASAL